MGKHIQILLDEYSDSHQNKTNKSIHWICVPVIFWTVVALLYSIPNQILINIMGESIFANWAVIGMSFAIIYYFYLSFTIALGMIAFSILCIYLSALIQQSFSTPLWIIAIVVFILSWVGQFYGHKVEGKKPSFLKDLQFLLIGPAWLMHFIYKRLGIKY